MREIYLVEQHNYQDVYIVGVDGDSPNEERSGYSAFGSAEIAGESIGERIKEVNKEIPMPLPIVLKPMSRETEQKFMQGVNIGLNKETND